MKRHPYEAAADRELERFPAVRLVGREYRGKSRALVVEFAGAQRSVFYPCTPSDCRGIRRHLQDIRRVLREMGVAAFDSTR